MQHWQTLAQARQRVQAHRNRTHQDCGAIQPPRGDATGPNAQTTPAQTLILAKLNGMARKLAERLLKPRSPVLVKLSQGLITTPSKQKQGAAAASQCGQQADATGAARPGWGSK